MALEDYANSRAEGQPVYLFLFTYGAGLVYAYNTGTQTITVTPPGEPSDIAFIPAPIEFGAAELKGMPEESNFIITVPRTLGIAQLFSGYPPTTPVGLVVYEGSVNEADDDAALLAGEQFDFYWRGSVNEASREGPESKLVGTTIIAALQRPGLQQFWQWPCQVALYSARCGADRASKTTSETVDSVAGSRVTLTSGWGLSGVSAEKYIGGEARWTSGYGEEIRRILRIENDDTLVLSGLVRELEATDSIDVIVGCDHSLDDCTNLHGNANNMRGFPWIPTDNPYGKNPFT